MNYQKKKNYIKGLLFRTFKGKVSSTDLEKVWEKLKDYEVEDWKKLKIVLKEILKEWWGEQLQPFVAAMVGDDLKEEVKNLVHAAIDFNFAIFNETLFYKFAQLARKSDLNFQQKITGAFFSLVPEVKKITNQRPRVADYYKIEKSVVEKNGKLAQLFSKEAETKEEKLARLKNINAVFESISADEIIILKKKLKLFALSGFAGLQKENSPLVASLSTYKEPFKLVLDLIDTIFRPELIKDVYTIFKKTIESADDNYELEFLLEKALEIGKPELKELLISLTNHLNKLTVGVPDKQISPAEAEVIVTKTATDIQQVLPRTPPESPGDPNPTGILWEGLVSVLKSDQFGERMRKNLIDELTIVRSEEQKKWYKDPRKVGPLAALGVIIISLICWLFFRKRNKRANYN